MGLFYLFNKKKREPILAKIENDRCLKERTKLLHSFRDNAKEFLKFKYQKSIILIINYCTLFVLHDKFTGHTHQENSRITTLPSFAMCPTIPICLKYIRR